MLLRSCLICDHHEVRLEDEVRKSFCQKENCWSRYSKCVVQRALERFLEQDRVDAPSQFSAIAHVYGEQ
ncbi:MAG: hypothetical protein ACUVXD_18440 [Thermodesulfobacteriota bacterium]